MSTNDHGQIIETAVEARGAERGPTMRNVLIWSTGLTVTGLAMAYFMFFGI